MLPTDIKHTHNTGTTQAQHTCTACCVGRRLQGRAIGVVCADESVDKAAAAAAAAARTTDALRPLDADEIDAVAGEAMNAAAVLRFQHLA